jgi:TRAP-type uncharacterized transport system fused permease subunit
MLSWKYAAPAFVVPIAFTIDAQGLGLLLQTTPGNVLWATVKALMGVTALAAAASGWIGRAATPVERALAGAAAAMLFAPSVTSAFAGASLFALIVAFRRRPEA